MKKLLPNLSTSAWTEVINLTAAITLLTNFVAMAGSAIASQLLHGTVTTPDIVVAAVLATILTGPIIFILSIKLQQLHSANLKLAEYATIDDLTGTLNRTAFTQELEKDLAKSDRPSCLLVVDVDKFKQVNDRFGHNQGDIALRAIADAMKTTLRPNDLIARLGGEEFGVYLPDCSSAMGLTIGERLRKAVMDANFVPEETPYQLSISIGLATSAKSSSFVDMYKSADVLLYTAKRNGRNRLEHETPATINREAALA